MDAVRRKKDQHSRHDVLIILEPGCGNKRVDLPQYTSINDLWESLTGSSVKA
jgi:hypothetical protein